MTLMGFEEWLQDKMVKSRAEHTKAYSMDAEDMFCELMCMYIEDGEIYRGKGDD